MAADTFTIHQAIFGDVRGAHNLIVSSPGADDRVLSDLASKYTDRLLPAELSCESYSSGFPLHRYYIVTRTFPVRASRSGMVQTHALIVPLEYVGDCSLRELLDTLLKQPTNSFDTPLISSGRLMRLSEEHVHPMPSGYAGVVRQLLNGQVPVWLGHEGFEDVVVFLWRKLWRDARIEMRFRVSAGPNDLADFPATLVWTPKSLRSNWSSHLVDQTKTVLEKPSIAEAYLMSLPQGDELGHLLERLRMPPKTISGLKRLENFLNLSKGTTADSIRGAVRLLGAIAPSPEDLSIEKKQLLDRLAHETVAGSEEDVLGLRNLDASSFISGDITLQNTIAQWLHRRIDEVSNATAFARELFLANHPWKALAKAGVFQEFGTWTYKHAEMLWHWWLEEPALVEVCSELIPDAVNTEKDFISTMPLVVQKQAREPILALAVRRQWYLLHAAVIGAASDMSTQEKLMRQLEVESVEVEQSGLGSLISKIDGKDLVQAAIELQEPRLIDFAGRTAATSPTLMTNLDADNPAWRSIWARSIEYGGQPFEGLNHPTIAAHQVMNAVVEGITVPLQLVERLAIENKSDLANFSKRSSLWEKLPTRVRMKALRLTAETWLKRFFADTAYDAAPLESELKDAVLESWRTSPDLAGAGAIPALYARFSDMINENDFVRWISKYARTLTRLEAIGIGQLVRRSKWKSAASALLRDLRGGRQDLSPAVHECVNLFGFWDKVYVSLFTTETVITIDEWWTAWVELSSSLYPHGIDDNNIWLEADGDRSRIKSGSGREQWRSALDHLRKGGAGGSMTIEGLLHQMRKDFPGNPDLALLENLYLRKLRML